jgi:hypothetical protein
LYRAAYPETDPSLEESCYEKEIPRRARYAVFGLTGALTFAAIIALAMLFMLRGRTR